MEGLQDRPRVHRQEILLAHSRPGCHRQLVRQSDAALPPSIPHSPFSGGRLLNGEGGPDSLLPVFAALLWLPVLRYDHVLLLHQHQARRAQNGQISMPVEALAHSSVALPDADTKPECGHILLVSLRTLLALPSCFLLIESQVLAEDACGALRDI